MPVTPSGVAGLLAPNMASAGCIGTDVPKLALGLGIGVSNWVAQILVQTADVGTAGVGSGGPMPLIVPPSLLGNMQTGFASAGLIGIFSPLLAIGISNGLIPAFLQGLIKTAHPVVGVGTGVAKFIAPPATPTIAAGLASGGVVGLQQAQLAQAVGLALDLTFASLVIPVPIVGAGSPTATAGTGTGKIV